MGRHSSSEPGADRDREQLLADIADTFMTTQTFPHKLPEGCEAIKAIAWPTEDPYLVRFVMEWPDAVIVCSRPYKDLVRHDI